MSFIYFVRKAESSTPLSASQFGRILKKERISHDQWVRLEPEIIANACIKDLTALRLWAMFFTEHVGRHYHSPEFHEFAAEFQDIELSADAMIEFITGNLEEEKVQKYLKRTILVYFEKRKVNGHPRDLNLIWPYLSVFAEHGAAPDQLFPQPIQKHDNSLSLNMVVTPHTRYTIEELLHHRVGGRS